MEMAATMRPVVPGRWAQSLASQGLLGPGLGLRQKCWAFFFFYSPADRPFVSFGGLSIIICEAGKCVPFSFFLRPASPQLFPSIPHIPEPLLSTAL